MDDRVSQVQIDPRRMSFPGQQTLSNPLDAGLTATDVRNAINDTARRVSAIEPGVAAIKIAVREVTFVEGNNVINIAGAPAVGWPRRVTIEGSDAQTVFLFDGNTVTSVVRKLSDPTATTYGKTFSMQTGGITIEAEDAGTPPGAGAHWEVAGAVRRVTLEFV